MKVRGKCVKHDKERLRSGNEVEEEVEDRPMNESDGTPGVLS